MLLVEDYNSVKTTGKSAKVENHKLSFMK